MTKNLGFQNKNNLTNWTEHHLAFPQESVGIIKTQINFVLNLAKRFPEETADCRKKILELLAFGETLLIERKKITDALFPQKREFFYKILTGRKLKIPTSHSR